MAETIETSSIYERLRGLPGLKRHIDNAPPLNDFDFTSCKRDEEKVQGVADIEPQANELFLLPFRVNSGQYYSFLGELRKFGIDVFVLISSPKGEATCVKCPLTDLQKVLKEGTENRRYPNLARKFRFWDFFPKGYFHVRLYSVGGEIVATAHIDPPELLDHLNLYKHHTGEVKTNYLGGEALFKDILGRIRESVTRKKPV